MAAPKPHLDHHTGFLWNLTGAKSKLGLLVMEETVVAVANCYFRCFADGKPVLKGESSSFPSLSSEARARAFLEQPLTSVIQKARLCRALYSNMEPGGIYNATGSSSCPGRCAVTSYKSHQCLIQSRQGGDA